MHPINSSTPICIVSDVHLCGQDLATLELFRSFVEQKDFPAPTLVLLGDLFESWIGDDAIDHAGREAARALAQLNARGVDIFFMPGNRDFLVGERYCQRAKMTLTDAPIVFSTHTTPTALTHGDELCTDDIAYQRFRKKTSSNQWRQSMLSLPVFIRRALRGWARLRSRHHGRRTLRTQPEWMDVSPQAVVEFAERHQIKRLIHGHTHQGRVHLPKTPNEPERWVLGEWQDGQGSYVLLTPKTCSLWSLALTEDKHISQQQLWPQPGH